MLRFYKDFSPTGFFIGRMLGLVAGCHTNVICSPFVRNLKVDNARSTHWSAKQFTNE